MKVFSLFVPSIFALCLTACGGGGGGGGGDTSTPPVVVSSVSSVVVASSVASVLSSVASSAASNSSSSMSSVASSYTPVPATLSLLAGGIGGKGNTDGTGAAARFYYPGGVAVDAFGNTFVADTYNHTIRKVSAAGVVTTFAGQSLVAGSANGTGAQATFNEPSAIAINSTGTLYVVERYAHRIRKITTAGVVTTLTTNLVDPKEIAVDASGSNIYVTDRNAILKINSAGSATILAGSTASGSGSAGYVDATGAAAKFDSPAGLVLTPSNTLLVADYNNHRIRQVTQAGVVTTFSGTGLAGSTNGSASTATFNRPQYIAADSQGNYFVTSNGSVNIRKVTAAGDVADFKQFEVRATALAIGSSNTVHVLVEGSLLYTVSATGTAALLAGSPELKGTANGSGNTARFSGAYPIIPDSQGDLYFMDSANDSIRKVTKTGVVSSYAGSAGLGAYNGSLATAWFNGPSDMAIDNLGNQYVTDTNNRVIRKISAGQVSTFAGSGVAGSIDGMGTAAQFENPIAITNDPAGNLYVIDFYHAIRKVTPDGQVTTLAGDATAVIDEGSQSVDGIGSAARFIFATDIVYATDGNLYVLDSRTVRRITLSGVVTTIAGLANDYPEIYVDGVGTAARFGNLTGIAADGVGNLYVADTDNNVVRKLSLQTYAVNTVVGTKNIMGFVPGATPGALAAPKYLAIFDNKLYITMDNAVVQVTPLP